MHTSRFYNGSVSIIVITLCLTTLWPISSEVTALIVTKTITDVKMTSVEPFEGNTLISGIDPVFEAHQKGHMVWYFSKKDAPGLIPYSIPLDADRLRNKNTLITYYTESLTALLDYPEGAMGYPSTVIEVAPSGEIVWNFTRGLDFAHDADRLTSGNTIIADSSPNVHNERIIEVDPSGNIVWEYKTGNGSYPNDVDVLPNGNVFISLRDWNSLQEVNRQGDTVWFYNGTGVLKKQHNSDVLRNNHILVCDSENKRILELNREGNIVAESLAEGAGGLSWPRDCDLLPNGNMLITDSRVGSVTRVIELNSEGDLVWEYEVPLVFGNQFYESDRLNVPPLIEVKSLVSGIQVTSELEIILSSPAIDIDHMWYRIYDVTNDQWLDPANITWTESVKRTIELGEYSLYAWGNDTGDWTQGDPNWSMVGGPTIVTFTVSEVPEFQYIEFLCMLSFVITYILKKKNKRSFAIRF